MRKSTAWVPVCFVALQTGATLLSEERIDTGTLGQLGTAWVTEVDRGIGVYALGRLGDVDGDGFDDVGMGIAEPGPGDPPVGPVFYVVYGRPRISGEVALEPTLERSWQLRAASSEPPVVWWGSVLAGWWGRAVHDAASVGDLDGDGFDDFLLGFGLYPDYGYPSSGVVLLVRGGRHLHGAARFEDLLLDPGTTVFRSSDPLHQQIGVRCRPAGDFDGDGNQDFLISAPGSRLGSAIDEGQGAAFIVSGGPDLPPEVDLALVGTELRGVRIEGFEEFREGLGRVAGLELGGEVASLGDFDGDGLSDVALLATERWPRATYIVLGQRDPPPVISLIDAASYPNVIEIRGHLQGSNSWFGHEGQAAALGDVNGDGRADLALARAIQCCPFLHPASSFVQVFFGSPDFPRHVDFEALDPGLGVMLEPAVENTLFGRYISPAGDFDGDGRPDLLVGAPYANPEGRSNAGEAYVLLSRSGFGEPAVMRGSFPGVRVLGKNHYEALGSDVAAAGDFDGDGFDDILAVSRVLTWERMRGTYPGLNRIYTIYGGPAASPFIRGDCNADSTVNLTDAISLLNHLFLGAPRLPCDDAADADDSSVLDLTDAVYLLNHLFLGGLSPSPPFPEPGQDPTSDDLGCRGL